MNTSIDGTTTQTMRHAMVASQLRTNAVNDQRVIAAMMSVPREIFVPEASRLLAYRDTALPAGRGRAINLPMVTGRLLTEAYLTADDRVLLIGAAGGYAAALLASIVASVVAVEEDAELVAIARDALAGTPNVEIVEGSLTEGYAAGAPYDVLIVDGAIEQVPDLLVNQVRTDGRVVTGLVEKGVIRLASGRKTDGGFGLTPFMDSDCVILPGFEKPSGFTF
ncbi:protein-L-isoaspartate O-methyltransferase family protein [Sphingomonas sp. XXL09]|uniref:protein-L-isoaspartate O-methyltransferase family protein n=1 Tax=Sphingomonas sp. XXL09 TaxID=3457787 RepID=UPI00406BD18B